MTRHLPTEARRAQILDAARSAMLAEGYQGARMSAIASAAGLSKGAIYFHFDSKQALAEALVDREFGRAHALVERALAQPEAPSIGALALTFAQVFLSEPGGPAERFVLLTGEIAVLDAVIGARIRALHTALVGGLAELLERWARAEGWALPDPVAAATAVKALSDGLQAASAFGVALDVEALFPVAVSMIEQGLRALGSPR
ncbi:MAG: TetR/AcrR family transcriptional regulator [Myxococcales bacterium]|nr:TetR/AcrR family transcriptional regulator [Myxococcales bacterium]